MRLPIPPCPPISILDFQESFSTALDLLSRISTESLLVVLTYGLLAGLYLLFVPLMLYAWMNQRWHRMGKVERLVVYGMVFLFFPGMILYAPFLNLRPNGQGGARI